MINKNLYLFCMLWCLVCTLMECAIAKNDFPKVYTISGIYTYADIGNLTDSKKAAIDKGIKQAFEKLLGRIASSKEQKRITSLRDVDYTKLAEDYTIQSERMTSHSYGATLTVSFKPGAVQSLLNAHGIAYGDTIYDSFLIIPYITQDQSSLSEAREWARIWEHVTKHGLLSPEVIGSDLNDAELLDFSLDLLSVPYAIFRGILHKYNKRDLVIVQASNSLDDILLIKMRLLGRHHNEIRTILYNRLQGESNTLFYTRVIHGCMEHLDLWWKGDKKAFE